MNILTEGELGIFLLETGGFQAVTDLRHIADLYAQYNTGKVKLASLITGPNLDALERTLTLFVKVVKDPAQKANLLAMLKSK